MAFPHLSPLARVATLTVIPFLLAGCGGGEGNARTIPPGVADAGHNLDVQVYKFLFATTAADVQVTDALRDKDVPCANGTVKRTYAVAFRTASRATTGSGTIKSASDKKASPKEVIDDLIDFVPQVGTFTVTRSGDDTLKLVNAKMHTRLTLHSPAPDRLVISGETDCLRKQSTGGHH
jgi:hypothetical protein